MHFSICTCYILNYYMASSASGQDERNRALWLATRAGKMERSCPLGTTRCIPQAKFPKSHIINPLLTKFVRSRWLDIGLVLFLRVYGPRLRLGHLVNNPYVYTTQVNSTFRARWLASSEVISQVLFTSEQPTKNKMAFVGVIVTNKVALWVASYSACVVYTKTIIAQVYSTF